ncbi:hypothetical protein ACFQX7_17285 [Luedemannella flava]
MDPGQDRRHLLAPPPDLDGLQDQLVRRHERAQRGARLLARDLRHAARGAAPDQVRGDRLAGLVDQGRVEGRAVGHVRVGEILGVEIHEALPVRAQLLGQRRLVARDAAGQDPGAEHRRDLAERVPPDQQCENVTGWAHSRHSTATRAALRSTRATWS